MDIKKWVLMAVSVITAAVVFGACLPIFADTTQATDTLTNEGYMRYSAIESTSADTVTITWDHTKPTKITVNTDEMDIIGPAGLTLSIAFANNFNFRYSPNDKMVDCFGDVSNTVSASVTYNTDITLVLSSGTATVTNTDETPKTATYSYTTAYYPDNNGAYIMKNHNMGAYVNPDSTIIIANGMTVVGSRVGIYFDGTIENGYTFNYFNTNATVTASNITTDYSEVANYRDVVSINKITFHLVKGGDEGDASYSYFLVPYEVTAERTVHTEGAITILMNLLPVLIGAGLLLGVVAVVIKRRM